MSSRTNTQNAFETTLASTLNVGVLSVDFTSVVGLSFPLYVTLEPEVPAKLEYMKVINISGNTVTFEARNLEGSAGDVAHDPGAVVRLTWLKQMQDDLFDDIEALEAEDIVLAATDVTLAGVDAAHLAADDPHGTAGTAFPAGTRLVFDQTTAPVGWTRDTSTTNDRVIRIVTGARSDGGTWTQPSHVHSGPSHQHSTPNHTHDGPSHTHTNPDTGTEANHTHTGAAHTHPIAAHTHDIDPHTHTNPTTSDTATTAIGAEGSGSAFEYVIKAHTHTQGTTGSDDPFTTAGGSTPNTNAASAANTGSDGGHDHTVGNTGSGGTGSTSSDNGGNTGSAGTGNTGSAATTNSWRPLHRDMIVAVKD
jgi:hypothetical protein